MSTHSQRWPFGLIACCLLAGCSEGGNQSTGGSTGGESTRTEGAVPPSGLSLMGSGDPTPEMAELMRRLGARRALMLDGGLSSQMVVRSTGGATSWPGVRRVPLALVAR